MPPGSGLEPVIEVLRGEIAAACPTAQPTHYMRKNFMVTDLAEVDQIAADFDLAIAVAGPAGTMVHLAVVFRRVGAPWRSVSRGPLRDVASDGRAFRFDRWRTGSDLADRQPTEHPEAMAAAARSVVADLTTPARTTSSSPAGAIPNLANGSSLRGSLAEINETFLANGWTDGLPIIPPTEEAVAAMLQGTSRSPDTVVSETFRPEGRRITSRWSRSMRSWQAPGPTTSP